MEFKNHIKLNKKDENKIKKFLQFFRKGLITGASIFAGFLLILSIIEGVKWLKQF